MVDFPVSNSEFSSEFRWVKTETHVHAWYGHSDRVSKVHAYEKGTLEGQNIQIHIENLLALENIKEGFDISSRRWAIGGGGAMSLFLIWVILTLATQSVNYEFMGVACGAGLLAAFSARRFNKYQLKSRAIFLGQKALTEFFENRLDEYMIESRPERIAFKNYYNILEDSRLTDWVGATINRNNYYDVLSDNEQTRIYTVLRRLPEELLQQAPVPN